MDYEFITGAPKSDEWYTMKVAVPSGGLLLVQIPGSVVKQKGTMRVTGAAIFPGKASGTIKIELRQGRTKNVSRVRLAAILETAYRMFRIKGEPRMTRFVANMLCTSHWFDISAAQRDLGYAPQVTISEGLRRLEAWINRHEGVLSRNSNDAQTRPLTSAPG